MQWLAVRKYGVLEEIESLTSVPVHMKLLPPSEKNILATDFAWLVIAGVATQAISRSQLSASPISSTGSALGAPPAATRCEICGILSRIASGLTFCGRK